MILLTIPIFWPIVQELDFAFVSVVELQTARLSELIASGAELPAAALEQAQALLAAGQEIPREIARELGLRGVSNGVLNRINTEQVAIWFGVVFCMNMQVSFLSPPFGPAAFYLKSVAPAHITLTDIFKGFLPFIAIQLIALSVLLIWPPIVTLFL